MNGTPRVSVVLPTYNRAGLLQRAIASVLGQSYRNFELLVVDDASEDGTPELLAGIADPRLRVLRQAQRRGAAHARNVGIRAARGGLIAFQDSDDEWLVCKLEQQLALLDASPPQVGWIGGTYLVEAGDRIYSVRSPSLIAGEGYDDELLVGEPFVTPTWLVRRELLEAAGLFDEHMPCLEDWDLIFKLAGNCHFRAVKDHILLRHGSADGLYANIPRRVQGLEVMLNRHRDRWLSGPSRYAAWCTELGRLHGTLGQPDAARRWLKEGLRYRSGVRAAILLASTYLHARFLVRLGRSRHFALHLTS
jgi:glycosyltransferase involved in cell wall biosynthesis